MPDLPAELFDIRLLVAIGAVAVAGFLRGFVGFGAALVAIPVLSLIYGPLVAVPVSNLLGLPAVLMLLPDAVRDSERPVVLPAALSILLAAPLGAWLLVVIDPRLVKILIALTVIAMVWMLWRGGRLPTEVGLGTLAAAGTAGGLLQGATGIGGPPVVSMALARPGSPRQQRGNVLALMSAVSLSTLIPFAWFGLFTAEVIAVTVLLIVPYLGAIALGARHFSGDGQQHYRKAALGVLLVIGVMTLLAGVQEYLLA